MLNRLGGFFGRWPPAFQPCQDASHLAHVQTGHRGFDPFLRPHGRALGRFGHLGQLCQTVRVIEHLTSMRKQGLHVLPYPLCSIAHDTESNFFFRNHARVLDLFEGLAELRLILSLMPTQQMDDTSAIKQGATTPLGVTPLALP